jgi:hypothetical protein
MEMARNDVNPTENDDQIEEREWKISSHDVPYPVPADVLALGTGKVI